MDLGGNCGVSALFFSSVWPNSTVVTVEPHPSNYAIARLNTFMQYNVYAEHAAIWGDIGYAALSPTSVFGSHLHGEIKGNEYALKFEELPTAAKSHVTRVIPRIK